MNLKLIHFPQNYKDDNSFFNIGSLDAYYQDILVFGLYTSLQKLGHTIELIRMDKKNDRDYYYKDNTARTGMNGPDNYFYMDLIILENVDTGKYIVLDMRDCSGTPWAGDSNCNGIFLTHFNRDDLVSRYSDQSYKVFPFYFCDYYPNRTKSYRSIVENLLELPQVDKLFFSGTITGITTDMPYTYNNLNVRQVGIELDQNYSEHFFLQKSFLDPENFFKKSSRFKMSLSLPGHPWCSREHEMFSLGIPLLAYRWKSERVFPFIPELHYTSIEIEPRTLMGFPLNSEEGAKKLIDKFLEVKDNAPLLKSRALAGQTYYDEYVYPTKFGEKFIQLVLPLFK